MPSSTANHGNEPKKTFTLESYIKMFDDDEEAQNMRHLLLSKYTTCSYEIWKKGLIEKGNFESVLALFSLYERKLKDRLDLINRLEVFSLLENIFRNAIVLPYIPAYRSINLYCGRYRSFVYPIETSVPFKQLNFERQHLNLLTYIGTNPFETMICARTCAYLHYLLKTELDDQDKTHGKSQYKVTVV